MKILESIKELKIVPRWMIFLFDLTVVFIAFLVAILVESNFTSKSFSPSEFFLEMLYCVGVTAVFFLVFRLYRGIIRYTSEIDSMRILGTLFFTFIFLLLGSFVFAKLNISIRLIFLYSLFSFVFLVVYRILIKIFFQYASSNRRYRKNTFIYGAGELGIAVKGALENDFHSNRFIVGFIDDDKNKIEKSIEGTKIFNAENLARLIKRLKVSELIVASHNISPSYKSRIVDICLEQGVNVLTIPPVEQIMNDGISTKQLKKVEIEDLLERSAIHISNDSISEQIRGKRVLITGAAGSIGSVISEQIGKYQPKMIILCDQAESPLHELKLDLEERNKDLLYHSFIADVRNEKRMRQLFETFKPHIVFHAAAYKHVPIMEDHPSESVRTNVFGTYTLANLSVEFGVEKFVFVSTDKAVNPTNVMGATKRIAEIYVQSLDTELRKNKTGKTRFITTRFGNVLGSNGSVIPRFRKQIEEGGPVTVTHPEITRYFMTIPEACELVIEAGVMGNGGEIFVFDMGKSVKIVHLAEKMIKLSGSTPYKDIDIKFTGLRPGEKLYEELLNDSENTLPTHHEKIMIAKVRQNDFARVKKKLETLFKISNTDKVHSLVKQMKLIVPEYKSKNSMFEQIDLENERDILKTSS